MKAQMCYSILWQSDKYVIYIMSEREEFPAERTGLLSHSKGGVKHHGIYLEV